MRLSIIIPAYQEEKTIAEVLRRVLAVDTGIFDKQIIVCDDGSRDATGSEIEQVAAAHPSVRLVRHARNRGKGAAIRTALERRTDLSATRLNVENAEYGLRFARNQRLPQLDLIASYGSNGIGGSASMSSRPWR